MPNPGFGDRHAFTTRVPATHAAVYRAAARARGMRMSDYIAAKMAELHELPAPDSVRARYDDDQEVLTESA